MKKIVTMLLLGLTVLNVTFAKSSKTAKKNSGISVGMTVQDLSNQIWSGSCESLKKLVTADGGKMVYLDCSNNSAKQIQQLENFISAKVNIIVLQPVDKNAVETTLAKARSQGIKVYCWDEDIQNADICWLIDNYALGKIIGEQAAEWINSRNNGVAEVAVLDYPQIPILLERGNGIVDALKEKAPKAKIVAQSSAINPTEGMAKMETIFQKNPNVKVVCCIGGGGAVGANEAAKAAGKISPDFGIFAADCTEQEMAAMKNNEGNRMSVLITGGPDEIAKTIYGWVKKLAAGEPVEKKVYRVTIPVTAANLNQYYK